MTRRVILEDERIVEERSNLLVAVLRALDRNVHIQHGRQRPDAHARCAAAERGDGEAQALRVIFTYWRHHRRADCERRRLWREFALGTLLVDWRHKGG